MSVRPVFIVMAGLVLLAACKKSDPALPGMKPAPAGTSTSAPSELPPAVTSQALGVAEEAARALLSPEETLQTIPLDAQKSATVSGEVVGYKTIAWAVPASAGQTLSVSFKPSNTNLYMNIQDAADTTGAAVHRGEADGHSASIFASRDTTYVIRPFQPRAMARRGERGSYVIDVTVQ